MENSNTFHQMRAVTRHIEGVPKEWQSTNDWDSHKPMLYLALEKIDGAVFEMGCGYGSTLMLHNECKRMLRRFNSYETNKEWAKRFPNKTELIENYTHVYINPTIKEGSILFIDCAPGEIRKELVQKNKNDFDIIIIHDTEPGADYVYGMSEILSTFKYRLDYQPEGKPHTTAVSNAVNVCSWI